MPRASARSMKRPVTSRISLRRPRIKSCHMEFLLPGRGAGGFANDLESVEGHALRVDERLQFLRQGVHEHRGGWRLQQFAVSELKRRSERD